MKAALDCTAAGDVAVLVESESESDDPTTASVAGGAGGHCGGGGVSGGGSAEPAATASPMNQAGEDDEPTHGEVKDMMAATCKDLLVKLETVRLSVLHLQYSLHTGALAEAATETAERSDKLWAWNEGGVFSAELAHGGCLQGALHNVFDGGLPAAPGLAYTNCTGAWVGGWGGARGGGAGGNDGQPDRQQQQRPQQHDAVDAANVGASVADGVDARGVYPYGHAAERPRMLAERASLDSTVGCAEPGDALRCGRIVACALGDDAAPYDV